MIIPQVAPPVPVVGDRAPDVSFQREDGSTVRLANFRGKVVVLEFTSLNCPPCRTLAPLLEALAAERKDVLFLTISVDPPESSAKLVRLRGGDARTVFLQDLYSVDRSRMAIWRFGNTGTPAMFVIDANGRFASRVMMGGVEDLPRLNSRIDWAKGREKK